MPATCRRAVAAAVLAAPGDEARTAREAAEAMVVAASNGDTSALAEVLRPDPTMPVPVWTVARYVPGDVSPRSLEHHDDPCAAVLSVARPNPADVATAELISVTDGLRWTPLVHTHSGLTFHPPEAWTLAEAEASGPQATAAAERWRRRARLWTDGPKPLLPEPVPASPAPSVAAPEPVVTPPPAPVVARPTTGSLASAIAAAVAVAVDRWPGEQEVGVDDVLAEVRRHLGSVAPPPEPKPHRSVDGSAVTAGDDLTLATWVALTTRLEAAVAAHERAARSLNQLVADLRSGGQARPEG
jgi:hypothetical protein